MVLGAYFGEGRSMRGQGLSTFLCGVMVPLYPNDATNGDNNGISNSFNNNNTKSSSSSSRSNSGTGDMLYAPLCKVGTGYTFADLQIMRQHIMDAVGKDGVLPSMQSNNTTTSIQYLPEYILPGINKLKKDDYPHIWIPPYKSFVVQLKCAELVTSTQFSSGYTCRFPRVVCVRHDKQPTRIGDIMTLSEVKDMFSSPSRNIRASDSTNNTNNNNKSGMLQLGNAVYVDDDDDIALQSNSNNYIGSDHVSAVDMMDAPPADEHSKLLSALGKKKRKITTTRSKSNTTTMSVIDHFAIKNNLSLSQCADHLSGKAFCVLESSDFTFGSGSTSKSYTRHQV